MQRPEYSRTLTRVKSDSGSHQCHKATPNDPSNVVSPKPCQSALSSKLVSTRNATVMTHPSRVLNFNMKVQPYMRKSYI